MKNSLPLLLLLCFAMPAFGQSANASGSAEAGLAGMLLLFGELLLVVVAVLVALAWIWFPFMVKERLDKILRKLDNIEQLQARLGGGPPRST